MGASWEGCLARAGVSVLILGRPPPTCGLTGSRLIPCASSSWLCGLSSVASPLPPPPPEGSCSLQMARELLGVSSPLVGAGPVGARGNHGE